VGAVPVYNPSRRHLYFPFEENRTLGGAAREGSWTVLFCAHDIGRNQEEFIRAGGERVIPRLRRPEAA
jgi:hypothetical protein